MNWERWFILAVVIAKAIVAIGFLCKGRWLYGVYWAGCAQVDLAVLLLEWGGKA